MPTIAKPTKASGVLLALAAGNIPGGTTQRYALDVSTSPGGVISVNTSNDAALTAQAEARVYVSHKDGALPGINDASWRKVATLFGTGTNNGQKADGLFYIPFAARFVMVEVGGHTGGSLSASIESTVVTDITST